MSDSFRQLRVLLIDTYMPDKRHSMKLFVRCLHQTLGQFGVEVSVLSPNQREVGFIGKLINKFIFFPYEIWRRGHLYDVIHICDTSHAIFLNLFRLPSVTTVHDLGGIKEIKEKNNFLKRLLGKLLLRGLSRSDLLVAVSKHSREELLQLQVRCGHPPELILNSTYQNFPIVEPTVENWLKLFPNIPFATRYILHLGSNEPRKNRFAVVRTLIEIRRTDDCHLIFAGCPPDDKLLREISDLGMASYVYMAPWPSEAGLAMLYRRAEALVFPSTYEGFGIPVVEAQMNYCPVVCSNIPPHVEILRGTGLTAEPDDSKAMAKLVLNIDDRPAMISAGLKNAVDFTPMRMAREYARAYQLAISLAKSNRKLTCQGDS